MNNRAKKSDRSCRSRLLSYRVEHVDTDASGAMHFARHASLMETVVLEKLESAGAGLQRWQAEGLDLVVVRLVVKYRAPVHFRDILHMDAMVIRAGAAFLRMAARVFRHADNLRGELVAEGELDLACVSLQNGAPAAIPTTLLTLIEGVTQ